MAEKTNEGRNLIALLLEDHAKVKGLLEQVGDAAVDQESLFRRIVKDLATHEVAEEEVVYPAVRSWVKDGEALADARVDEQQQTEVLLASMERMEPDTAEFRGSLEILRSAVLEHATHEEVEVFPALRRDVAPERLATLAQAYTVAKAMAPTHPHPNAPNTFPGNVLVGPAFAIVDRAYDVVRSALQRASSSR
ncbi:MAG TPA: hemerythrin domain-containing protein [Acidimicrobiales bacterium]|jgi:hemerythrin superfamily protein|nr:hemerythrin domain-containing protein [Acidimicrobiales bacterium]